MTYIAHMPLLEFERRRRRSGCLADALRFQLEACREDEGLAAIVVADDLGFCVAHAGADASHEELAARLPMLADPARRRSIEERDALRPAGLALTVRTFSISGAQLHACAVSQPQSGAETCPDGGQALARVASGFTRLLAQ